jgi:ribokinase
VSTVAVVGSANLDLVVLTPTRPTAGETVLGENLSEHAGGKGLNQAMAAAGLVPTSFIGRHGDDDAGRLLRSILEKHNAGTTYFRPTETATGRAIVLVTPDGENSITVLPGANRQLSRDDVLDALDDLDPAIVLTQLECGLAPVTAAAQWTEANHKRFVVNASPVTDVPEAVLGAADPLIVNQLEAFHLSRHEAPVAAAIALGRQCHSVVITLGSQGALVLESDKLSQIPATQVTAVDTTGAGDAFAGVLAARLAASDRLTDAARLAGLAAATLIQRHRSHR